jgi:HPt (histidine-containing phosphotransfer) domain-containing protein
MPVQATEYYFYSSLGDDPDLAEIVELFVEEMPCRVSELQLRYGDADWAGLGRLAHQLKGSAGSYGFEQITPLASRLELACRAASDTRAITDALDDLISMCQRLRANRDGHLPPHTA